jgi:hypothetical protein
MGWANGVGGWAGGYSVEGWVDGGASEAPREFLTPRGVLSVDPLIRPPTPPPTPPPLHPSTHLSTRLYWVVLDAGPCRALTARHAAHHPVRHGTEPPVAASVDSVGGDTGRCRRYLCLAAVERPLEGACEQGHAPSLAQCSEHAAERIGTEQGGRRWGAVRQRGVELLLSGEWPMVRGRMDSQRPYGIGAALSDEAPERRRTPRHTAAHRRTPPHAAAHRRTPPHTAAHRRTPPHTAAHRRSPSSGLRKGWP